MAWTRLFIGLTALIGLGPARTLAQPFVPVGPAEVKFQAEQLSGPALPYQAVRIRCFVQNMTKKKLGPLLGIDGGKLSFRIKKPGDQEFQEAGSILVYERFELTPISVPSARAELNNKYPLFLGPGDKNSMSFAFVKELDTVNPVFGFPAPGSYHVKCGYLVDGKKNEYVYDTVEIRVEEPLGADKKVYEILKKDPALAADLLNPTLQPVQGETYAKLKKLLEDFPDTTYTPYARLALARCYLTAQTPGVSSRRVARALAADELEKVVVVRYDPLLKKVSADHFPFRPQALAMQANLFDSDRHNALSSLHKDHRDSLQWINEFARILSGAHKTRHMRADLQNLIEPAFRDAQATTEEVWHWFRKT